jgi:hypothetical protein
MKTAVHPCLPFEIYFDPIPHTYTDSECRPYISGTSFVKRFFPAFDAKSNAERVACRDGLDADQIQLEWKAKGEAAADFGTLVHSRAEHRILGQDDLCRAATNDREASAFGMVDSAIEMLESQYEWIAVEQIVFDPLHLIAGQIDALAKNRLTGAISVMDWKTCVQIDDVDYRRRALLPIEHINDSKIQKYRLQLSLYAWIMLETGYFPPDTHVELSVIHLPPMGAEPQWIPLDYAATEVNAMANAWWALRDGSGMQNAVKTAAAGVVGAPKNGNVPF